MNNPAALPVIPEFVTVHLGRPTEAARNVTVPFLDYVSNVASSEIYPTWPENALRANIYAQVSFVLNRIYTEFYRSRGYDFDITNSTSIDQSFVEGREIFDNIRELAAELFDSYVTRGGNVEPYFTQYCDGDEVRCDGLEQWGTVPLAEQGLTPFEILQYYYGDDIGIRSNVPVENSGPSAPEIPLREGITNNDVRTVQIRLNRISRNYPAIPKIIRADGIFADDTTAAVRAFQEIVGLTPDGVVGKATWYAILFFYNAVKRLNELDSEGIALQEVSQQYPGVLAPGASGNAVENLQFYINYVSDFYPAIPSVVRDGIYGPETENAVRQIQYVFGLSPDGVVGERTWNALYNAYLGIVSTIPLEYREASGVPFPGATLRIGSEGEDVLLLQRYLNRIAEDYPEIPEVGVTGYFGNQTEAAVIAFQQYFGTSAQSGVVDAITWDEIVDVFDDVTGADSVREGQYPGYPIE
ncbi:MAG: peptidoglycan-binding protein [Clostridia bacterium]|nr:peptidoglycan-binding protein [Clostridia bacterium]